MTVEEASQTLIVKYVYMQHWLQQIVYKIYKQGLVLQCKYAHMYVHSYRWIQQDCTHIVASYRFGFCKFHLSLLNSIHT